MGQAKRRKLAGDYPVQTSKRRAEARVKVDPIIATVNMLRGIETGMKMNQMARMFGPPKRKDGKDG